MDRATLHRIKLEEEARLSAREDFAVLRKPGPWASIYSFFNSSLGLFILGTLVVGSFGKLYSLQQERQRHSATIWEAARKSAIPAVAELDFRLNRYAYDLMFTSESLLQESRRLHSGDGEPILGRNLPADFPFKSQTGFVGWLEITPNTLDMVTALPRYRGWTFHAVLTDLKAGVALVPECAKHFRSFEQAYGRVEATREILERAARKITVADADEIDLEVLIATSSDGGISLTESAVTGVVARGLPDGGKDVNRDVSAIGELAPLMRPHLNLLAAGLELRSSLTKCLAEQ